jgi:regulator of protease activity HflC (stomatin/prohibitin superfamily)
LRTHKSFYQYEVRTSDNVRLQLEGTIFWRIEEVRKMLEMTSDPEGDIWTRCRSTLIGAISNVSLGVFMTSFNDIVIDAFERRKDDTFYSDRGLELISMEMTNYAPVDEHTRSTLQAIIRQTVKRINELQKQQSANDVAKEKLAADIGLENNRTVLIEYQSKNDELVAQTAGAIDGGKTANSISSFLDGLNKSITDPTARIDLFKHQKLLQSAQVDVEQLSSGKASLYLAPTDMELRLQMPHEGSEL